MNQFVQKVLLQFINNPTLQNQNIEFVPSSNKIQYFIEEKMVPAYYRKLTRKRGKT